MVGSMVTGSASNDMVKNPKSVLKNLVHKEKFKESLSFVQVQELRVAHSLRWRS